MNMLTGVRHMHLTRCTTNFILANLCKTNYNSCQSFKPMPILINQKWNKQIMSCSTINYKNIQNDGIFKSALEKIRFFLVTKDKLKLSGTRIYVTIDDLMNTEQFITDLELEDCFSSWFYVRLLHVWIITVRLMTTENKEIGKILRNAVLNAFYDDCEERSKKLGPSNSKSRKAQLKALLEGVTATFLSYDAGLCGDDKILAASIWRMFYNKKCNDPEKIECLVQYIRANVSMLDRMTNEELVERNQFKFIKLLRPDKLRSSANKI